MLFMRTLALTLILLTGTGASTDLSGQALDALMTSIRNGGGWVSVPIEGGRASVSTTTLPTLGMTLSGCVRVWDGQSGSWEIRAHDTIGDGRLEVRSEPGRGVPFSYTFGVRSQFDFEIVWSEPRDTTLFLWVGLDGGETDQDACTPRS